MSQEKESGELKLTQLLHLALDIPKDQEELYEKNAQKTYCALLFIIKLEHFISYFNILSGFAL